LNKYKLSSEFLSGLPASLTQLFISDFKGLTSIATNTFQNLPLLERLSLNDNSINTIKPGAFNHLSKLTRLELKGNNLTDFSFDLLSTNFHLKVLDLSENKLSCIPKRSVFNLPLNLVNLNLSENNIESADCEEFEDLLNLRSLSISGNSFECFDLEGILLHSMPYLLDFNLGRLCRIATTPQEEEKEIKPIRRKEDLLPFKCRRNRVAVSTKIKFRIEQSYLDKLVNEGVISVKYC
jgi:Leucine-rich repeat (LRR) protein